MQKHCSMYHDRGVDVLNVACNPTQFVWPKSSMKTIESTIDFISQGEREKSALSLHGISVGGFMCGQFLRRLHSIGAYEDIARRVRAAIFESTPDAAGFSVGIARSLTTDPQLGKVIERIADCYLAMFKTSVHDEVELGAQAFRANSLAVPTLYLYSMADRVSHYLDIEAVIDKWIGRGVPVETKSWQHPAHLKIEKHHPEEYWQTLHSFLNNVNGFENKSMHNAHEKA